MSSHFKIESGVQLLARLTRKPNIVNCYPALFPSGPTNGDVIEITSEVCTSHLLTDIISEVLIQNELNGNTVGVLIFCTDGNLNYDELVNVIRKKLSSLNKTQETELHNTLTNMHFLHIYDAMQLYVTIHKLENILVEHPNISIIIFNSLTAFYWSEQGFKITKMDLYTKSLINMIQKVTKEYKTILMYTRPKYFCTNKHSENVPLEVNHQIQILDSNDTGHYQVNIKTPDIKRTQFFRFVDGYFKWI